MSNSSGFFTVVCTIALGGAILYLLQRIRHTDRQLKLLHSQARQIVDVGEIKSIVHKVVQSRIPSNTLPANFNAIVDRISKENIQNAARDSGRSIEEETVEQKPVVVQNVSKTAGIVNEESTTDSSVTTLSFDDDAVPGPIQRLAQQVASQ